MSQKKCQIYSATFLSLDLDPLIKYQNIFSGTPWPMSSTLCTIIAETRLQSQESLRESFYRQNATWRVSLRVLQFSLVSTFLTLLHAHTPFFSKAINIHNWECSIKHSKYNYSAIFIPKYWQRHYLTQINKRISLSRWPRGLRCGPAAARLLGLPVRIPSEAWMFVSCECCELCRQKPLRRADHSSRGVLPIVCFHVCDQMEQ
jgi:hypothetical protein